MPTKAEELFDEYQRHKADRAHRMPTTEDALRVIADAHERLKELGWRQIQYGPKQGVHVELIEPGCTAVLTGYRNDVRGPNETWWVETDCDLWPSRPIMWRRGPFVDAEQPAQEETP